jgi:hypothetical protein
VQAQLFGIFFERGLTSIDHELTWEITMLNRLFVTFAVTSSLTTLTHAQEPFAASSFAEFANAAKSGQSLAPAIAKITAARAAGEKAELLALGVDVNDLNRPWQIFLKALVDKLQFTDGKYIQVITSPQPADWNNSQYGTYRTYFYGDTMPKWGTVFDPENASSFADVYGTFINSIVLKLTDPNDQTQADTARTKWTTCSTALQNQYGLVGKDWKAFNDNQSGLPQSKRMTFDQWYSKFAAPVLQSYESQCNALAIDYNSWFNKATVGQANLANAISRYATAKQINALVPNTTDQYQAVWPYAFVQSLGDFITASDAAPGLAFDQTFNRSSGTYSATTTTWGGSASYGWFIHASASGSSTTVDTHNDAFGMTVQMKGLQVFDVRPGDWFSQQLIQAWEKGPFQPNSIIQQKYAAGTLYGNGGFFSLRSARFVVAYQPKVVLKMSASNYHDARSSWSAGGGLSIGPFSFGGSGGSSSTQISWDDQNNTLTAQDTSKVPQVIAVVLDVLPDFK